MPADADEDLERAVFPLAEALKMARDDRIGFWAVADGRGTACPPAAR